MDVERITTELYGLAPERFVAARDAYVAEAREEKDTKAAKAIAGLRRPTLAAWVANHLARERPEEAEGLLTLGRTLREAHRTLDAPQLREAGRRQHQVTAALAREAAALARDAGHPVSEAVLREVTEILHAVLADPEAGERWVAGRLVRAPEPVVGFGAVAAVFQTAAIRTHGASPDVVGALVNATANIGIGGGAALGALVLDGAGVAAVPYTGAVLVVASLVVVLVARKAFPGE